jgi:hypothetical protein
MKEQEDTRVDHSQYIGSERATASSNRPRSTDETSALLGYGDARRVQLFYRRQQLSFRCEFRDDETPACWQAGMGDESDWCEPCRLRQPIYRDWRLARAKERKALRHLQRQLVRAQEGR